MTFYQTRLNKFLQFLGRQAEEPMGEITKKDILAFRNSLVRQMEFLSTSANEPSAPVHPKAQLLGLLL
jgi:hypothetical protein